MKTNYFQTHFSLAFLLAPKCMKLTNVHIQEFHYRVTRKCSEREHRERDIWMPKGKKTEMSWILDKISLQK